MYVISRGGGEQLLMYQDPSQMWSYSQVTSNNVVGVRTARTSGPSKVVLQETNLPSKYSPSGIVPSTHSNTPALGVNGITCRAELVIHVLFNALSESEG